MSQLPLVMLPKGNFFGRRIFVELKPGDNAEMLGLELDRIINDVVKEKLTDEKAKERFNPAQVKIIRTG